MRPTSINAIQPVVRFREILEALRQGPSWWIDDAFLRFAAQASALRPASAEATAAQIRATVDEIRAKAAWCDRLGGAFIYVVAATLVAAGDTVDQLVADVRRMGPSLRTHGFHGVGGCEVTAILVMRVLGEGRSPGATDVARVRAIYDLMRGHHWWLTRRDDLPACALLADRGGSAAEAEALAEGVYQALSARGLQAGDPLQTASLLLPLIDDGVDGVTARYLELMDRFAARWQRLPADDYAAVALLAWLDHDCERIVDRFLELIEEMRAGLPMLSAPVAETITADLVFIDLVRLDRHLRPITDEPAIAVMRTRLRRQRAASLALARIPPSSVVLAPDWPLLWP
jgi:hypothetical protein